MTDHYMQDQNPIVIIGGGLTGISLAAQLDLEDKPFILLEKNNRLGGQINTIKEKGFIFETGPNTGTISTPEVIDLFEYAAPDASIEIANASANNRWIWKGNRFHSLPNGLWSGLNTPLFSWKDKLGIPFEPFRKRGTDPNESVGQLAERRLGKSMVDYAVDPFVGGVYAGDPYQLVTRIALPKLYNLEQNYGSFIGGAIKKAKEKKSEREKLATKEVFSAVGGLSTLVKAVGKRLSRSGIGIVQLGVSDITIERNGQSWLIRYTDEQGVVQSVISTDVVTTVRADILPTLFEEPISRQMNSISTFPYAPVSEVSIGFNHLPDVPRAAFGGLVPGKENRQVLGILFPDSCFRNRCPHPDSALFTVFMGGIRNRDIVEQHTEEAQIEIALKELYNMMKIPGHIKPDLVHIAHYPKAIPQYDFGAEKRQNDIAKLESEYPGLHIAGGIKDGIGMAHRITQGMQLGKTLR